MIALDTSVVVAAFAPWHEHHAIALEVLADAPRLPVATAIEAYSVITRLPDPFRAEPKMVVEFLDRTFATPRLELDLAAQTDLPATLQSLGVSGGATYDGVIALTAQAAGARVVSLDRRAAPTYERCGVEWRLLG